MFLNSFFYFFTVTCQTEYFPDLFDLFSHIRPEMSQWKEDIALKNERNLKGNGTNLLTPSHSKLTHQISLLLVEPLGNSVRLPVGGRGDT